MTRRQIRIPRTMRPAGSGSGLRHGRGLAMPLGVFDQFSEKSPTHGKAALSASRMAKEKISDLHAGGFSNARLGQAQEAFAASARGQAWSQTRRMDDVQTADGGLVGQWLKV